MSDLSHPAVPGPFVTISVLMLSGMTVMANATIAPALPALKAQYGAVHGIETLVGLLMTLPSLAIMLTASLAGWGDELWAPAQSDFGDVDFRAVLGADGARDVDPVCLNFRLGDGARCEGCGARHGSGHPELYCTSDGRCPGIRARSRLRPSPDGIFAGQFASPIVSGALVITF